MSLVFAWEKMYLAVDALCGRGSQVDRLIDATTLCLSNIRPDDLPVELRGEFIQLMDELTAVRVNGVEANIRATANSLDASDRDKAIGKIFMNHQIRNACFGVMSSRLSYELVQKAARAGLEMLVGISRPTSLGVDLARAVHMTLVCVKQNDLLVFSGRQNYLPIVRKV